MPHRLSPLSPEAALLTWLLTFLSAACALAQDARHAPLPRREFRAAWVATVNNIDWPSRPGLPTEEAKGELRDIVRRAETLRLNALVFQVRPSGCAFYASELEPWSEWLTGAQGRAPDPRWDPLQFLLDEAHPRGIEVHAWCNPYRARHVVSETPEAEGHVLRRLPEACVRYGGYRWMDPGDPRAAAWSLRVMRDIVARYDVDGIHIDDYFYPYPEKGRPFPDDDSYRRYRDGGGELGRDDWRRHNIDEFVRRLYEQSHAERGYVRVGISPFGIARPGLPEGIQAGIDQYSQLYADVLGWQRRGWCDYLSPQLYWPIDQEPQSFAVLLPWWCAQNPQNRHVWPGINPGRAKRGRAPWRRDEIAQQVRMIRAQTPTTPGHVHFSFKALREESAVTRALRSVYTEPAPVPPCPWLPAEVPGAPRLRVDRDGDRLRLWVETAEHARFYCVQARLDRRWRTVGVRGAATPVVLLPPGATRVTVRCLADNGVMGAAASVDVE